MSHHGQLYEIWDGHVGSYPGVNYQKINELCLVAIVMYLFWEGENNKIILATIHSQTHFLCGRPRPYSTCFWDDWGSAFLVCGSINNPFERCWCADWFLLLNRNEDWGLVSASSCEHSVEGFWAGNVKKLSFWGLRGQSWVGGLTHIWEEGSRF